MKKGKTKISKRGRTNLRNILYQAALIMSTENETYIYEYFKKEMINKLRLKQATVVLSVLLIKVTYTLCAKKELYSYDKVHGLESYLKVA